VIYRGALFRGVRADAFIAEPSATDQADKLTDKDGTIAAHAAVTAYILAFSSSVL